MKSRIMKRLLLIWALFLCSLTAAFAQFSGSGSGTKDDPYLIFYAEQLNQMRNFLGKDSVYFKLMSDIDLTSFQEDNYPNQGWLPVGNNSAPFKGKLYGNNHKITGLSINRKSEDYVGFFGKTQEATVQDLTIEAINVIGNNFVGGFCGASDGSTIQNVTIGANSIEGGNNIGGFCGVADSSTLTAINASGDVNGSSYIGGFCGKATNTSFTTCSAKQYSSKGIVATVDDVSGFLANGQHVTLTSCSAEANVKGTSGNSGGMAGYAASSNFIDCTIEENR